MPAPIPTCPACSHSPRLVLYQPLTRDPERLLAVCEDCGRWYLRASYPDGRSLLTGLAEPLPAVAGAVPVPAGV